MSTLRVWSRAVSVLFLLLATEQSFASNAPKWSDRDLARLSEAVLTGRVLQITSGWDPAVNTIYTYVTVDVDEVLKGAFGSRQVIVKQLGGVVDDIGLTVADQPTFAIGERVLLYLEVRPRDSTLYTAAQWQGKWTLESDTRGGPVAVRRHPGRGGDALPVDRQALSVVRALVATTAAAAQGRWIQATPAEAGSAQPFALMGPYRYLFSAPVDVQAGGQPGLAGGGLAEIQSSIARWNTAGSSFQYTSGVSNIGPHCSTTALGVNRVSIAFNDPCHEISDAGPTISLGGSYHSATGGGTVNGVVFGQAHEGFIVLGNGALAQQYLTQSGCFADVQLHELGHVLGLDHSADGNAIMFPMIHDNCGSGPNPLGQDDLAGLFFIYPPAGGGPGTPTNVVAVPSGSVLNVSWTAPVGTPAPTGYRLDFRSGGTIVASTTTGPSTSVSVSIPPGTQGVFTVTVTGLAGSTAGSPSAPVTFTLGGAGCTAPPPTPTGLTGSIIGGIASVQFNRASGATSYIVQVGTAPGLSNLFNANIGDRTSASGAVPAGFQGYVRVMAVNACGRSAPTADFHLP